MPSPKLIADVIAAGESVVSKTAVTVTKHLTSLLDKL